jgi:hypothetical protein
MAPHRGVLEQTSKFAYARPSGDIMRTQSPTVAAKRAKKQRRERRKENLMLSGIILLMIASMVAYAFYLKFFYFSKPGYSKKPTASGLSLR